MARPTIAELEAILDQEEEVEIDILPNGEVRARHQSTTVELGMSIVEVTTRISKQWLMQKTKDELASIILANIDQIDLFSEKRPTITAFLDVAKAAEQKTDDAWIEILDEIWREYRAGGEFENWPLAASARRALQKTSSYRPSTKSQAGFLRLSADAT